MLAFCCPYKRGKRRDSDECIIWKTFKALGSLESLQNST